MMTFSEFVKMKQLDMNGSDIKKSERAGIRAIVECIKENERFIVNVDKKKMLSTLIEKLLEKSKG